MRRPRPPQGIMPRRLWLEERYECLTAAVERYRNAELEVPSRWIKEMFNLFLEIRAEESA